MIKRYLFKTLLFIYFTASYLGAVHIHHDSEGYHDNCQICVVTSNLHHAAPPPTSYAISSLKITYQPIHVSTLAYHFSQTRTYQAQAPPHFFS